METKILSQQETELKLLKLNAEEKSRRNAVKVKSKNKKIDSGVTENFVFYVCSFFDSIPEGGVKLAEDFLYRYLAGKQLPDYVDVFLVNRDKNITKYLITYYSKDMTKILWKFPIEVENINKGNTSFWRNQKGEI